MIRAGWALVLCALLVAGCASSQWVTKAGTPADPQHVLRCDEYVTNQNGPRFTGFEYSDRNKCMRAYGYVREWEVEK
jgi:hypothetical protein